MESKLCFRFRLPAQTDLAQASGHPKPSRMHQHLSPYLQSSSRWSIYTLVRRTTFLPCGLGFQFETPLSPVESFCTVTPKVKILMRGASHSVCGSIATHARFFRPESHAGGAKIPRRAVGERAGLISAYWLPKRAPRGSSHYLV